MAKPQNAFLAKLKAEAQAKEAKKTEAHVEIDTIAMLLMVRDIFQCGSGRAGKAMIKELDEDKSKKKEIIILRRDLAKNLKELLGKESWEKYHTLFPFLRDYWEW